MSNGLLLLIIATIITGMTFLYYMRQPLQQYASSARPQSIQQQPPPQPTVVNVMNGGDSRYQRAPEPLQSWYVPPEFPPRGGVPSIPINIPTQGLPASFQSLGMLNVDGQMLPLYGRRTIGSSDRWNYYTRTDTYNPVPIPLSYQKRDCMDDTGCNEIYSGDNVHLQGTGQRGQATIYRSDGPKYIPGIF